MSVAAIIITFNPNILLLQKNVESISVQVDQVIVYDNNSSNISCITSLLSKFNNVTLYSSDKNNGISKATNDSVKMLPPEVVWFLTLDQDSVCPDNLIEEYKKYIQLPNVGLMCPQVRTSTGKIIQERTQSTDIEYINRCITSACFVKKSAFEQIGGLDEKMFIDGVDHDLCKRFELAGIKMIRCNNVELKHNLGSDEVVKASVLFNKLFGSKLVYQTYSPFRVYHLVRNNIYYLRKFKGHLSSNEVNATFKLIFQHVALKSIIVSNHRWLILKAIFKGAIDGFKL